MRFYVKPCLKSLEWGKVSFLAFTPLRTALENQTRDNHFSTVEQLQNVTMEGSLRNNGATVDKVSDYKLFYIVCQGIGMKTSSIGIINRMLLPSSSFDFDFSKLQNSIKVPCGHGRLLHKPIFVIGLPAEERSTKYY